jgi:hypothetical protein
LVSLSILHRIEMAAPAKVGQGFTTHNASDELFDAVTVA